MITITFITGNVNKLREVSQIIGKNDRYQIVHRELDLPEYQGNKEFILEEKCKRAAASIDGPVLVEDTSLWY
ncbi:cathepsin O-like cysteine peptidase protein [Sarcoptes scabiei]|nr:cathepsin O-like cysteine peptidase protein [Sarcoptes scabiei]